MSAIYELAAIRKVVQQYGLGDEETVQDLLYSFEHAPTVPLDDSLREDIAGHAWDVDTLEALRAWFRVHGKSPRLEDQILNELSGDWLPPLILRIKGKLVLVAGNVRLMVTKTYNAPNVPVKIVDYRG